MSSPFIHEKAVCETDQVGEGTRIWAFAHVLKGAVIGKNCNICDYVFIEGDVVIGDDVTVKCGVQLWNGIRLEDKVFVGPNATFTNDPFPRSRKYLESFPVTKVKAGASVGANATILPGITIGENAMIGAGSVVTHAVPANTVVMGNPARIIRYVDSPVDTGEDLEINGLQLAGLVVMPAVEDLRGNLCFGEFERHIPFSVKRFFIIHDVPNGQIRGEHAHLECHQFLICIQGSCHVILDDGSARREYVLDTVTKGLYLPPMTWGVQHKYSRDAMLLVFASHYYDPEDYIREYDEFVRRTEPLNRDHPLDSP